MKEQIRIIMPEQKKKQYIANVGIDFTSTMPPIRVEAGETLPDTLNAKLIKEALDNGDISEAVIETSEVKHDPTR